MSRAQVFTESLNQAISSKNPPEIDNILKSTRDTVPTWTLSFPDAIELKDAIESIPAAITSEESDSLVQLVLKLVTDIIQPFQKISEEWWKEPPLPTSPTITLSFRDATAECLPSRVHDTWDSIVVEADPNEDFRDAFQRFRFQGNKRYRHPLLPSLNFDLVVSKALPCEPGQQSCTLLPASEAGNYLVKSLLVKLQSDFTQNPAIIRYVRNDHQDSEMRNSTPAQAVPPWKRLLPGWFIPAPSSSLAWIEPTPPPAFTIPDTSSPPTTPAYKLSSYHAISTLKYAGTGRNILPTNLSPSIVAKCIYLPIDTYISPYGISVGISGELFNDRAQLVRTNDRVPLPLGDNQAGQLLGRVVQYSIEPLPAPTSGRPKKKSRKSVLTEFVTVVWGYDPATRLLHCTDPSDYPSSSFVIDLSKPGDHAVSAPSTTDAYGVKTQYVHWIGLVSLPEDERARSLRKTEPAALQTPEQYIPQTEPTANLPSAFAALAAQIEKLNASNDARVFEVAQSSDTLLIGDVQLSKEGLDFELTAEPLRRGTWRISEPSENEVTLTCVDSSAQSNSGGQNAYDGCEILGKFSVDAGVGGAFLSSAFEESGGLHGDGDHTAVLETLMDHVLQGSRRVLAVPGGIVFTLDDGGYVVRGRRDEQELVMLKIGRNVEG